MSATLSAWPGLSFSCRSVIFEPSLLKSGPKTLWFWADCFISPSLNFIYEMDNKDSIPINFWNLAKREPRESASLGTITNTINLSFSTWNLVCYYVKTIHWHNPLMAEWSSILWAPPLDRGAWWATVHQVAKSRPQMKWACTCAWCI